MEYSCLSITKEQFLKIYAGTKLIDQIDTFYTRPTSDTDILQNYLPSKLWRLNNLYTIVDKMGKPVIFQMNMAQHKVYAHSLRHPRLIILKSRQQGISTFWLVAFFDDAICNTHFSIGLMAQGNDEAATLLKRTKFLWDTLPDVVKNYLGIANKTDNTKEFAFTNNSVIFIRTSFRSATLQRLHISEMGKIANKTPEKAQETKTGTLQALAQGNIGVIESTAEGDNLFKEMWDASILYMHNLSLKDFYPIFLSWIDDPDCVISTDQVPTDRQIKYFKEIEEELGLPLTQQQKNFWVVQARELGDRVYQEYPTTPREAFMSTKDGTYYARSVYEWIVGLKRIWDYDKLYDKNLAVQLSVDLGMDDTNAITVFQTYRDEFRVLADFQDNGQWIKYYTDWMKDQPWFSNLNHVILPHDAEVKEHTSGKTRYQVFEEELATDKQGNPTSINITQLPKTESVNDDIEKVRQVIPKLYLSKKAEYTLYCLSNYKKEYNEKLKKFRSKPLHNEASNGADSIRYMIIGAERGTIYKTPGLSSEQYRAQRMLRIGNRGEVEL